MGLIEQLKLLFTKEKGDEDPIIIEDSEEPIIESAVKPEVSKSDAEDPLKNISTLPKVMSQEVKSVEVVPVVVEEKVEVKAVEVKAVESPKPAPPPPAPKKRPRFDSDGFTSTRGLY
jgi:hypothetical protein